MKRVLGIALALVSMGFVASAEAKTANVSSENSTLASAAPQWQRDRYGRRYDRRYDRRQRTVSQTVRYGRRLYRETYLVTYWPNGRYSTRLISRTRIG